MIWDKNVINNMLKDLNLGLINNMT